MAENAQYAKVKEITDQLEAGIQDLFNSDRYKTWLNTMGKFHNYSLNNTLLIAMQKPDATLVAGYTSWQKNFGRQVQKGEKAIKILAPTPYKKKMEVDKRDPESGKLMLNPDGTIQKEIREVLVPAFKVANVFDISSTEGKELPTIGVNELNGSVQQYEMLFQALKESCPVPVGFEQIDSGAKGYYHLTDHRIAIQEGMSEVQTVKTMIHEMTHQKLHAADPKEMAPEDPKLTRNEKEVEAESVAYTICQHYGIDTSDYSFAYIAGWSQNKDTPELKASMGRIRDAACEMITEIDGHLEELQKQQVQEKPAVDEARDAKAQELAERLDALAFDVNEYEYRDTVDDPEANIAMNKEDLLSENESLELTIEWLMENVVIDALDEPQEEETLALLDEIKDFLGEDNPIVQQHYTSWDPATAKFEPGLQDNGNYRYYSTQRPVDLGTYPNPYWNKPVEIHNFDSRIPVEDGKMQAWGYLEYKEPLSLEAQRSYELKPATMSRDASLDKDGAEPEKKSVLEDLHAKQEAKDSGEQPHKKSTKTKGEIR